MTRLESICEKCKHKVQWVEETNNDLYSYKRNGHCFNKEEACAITGQKQYEWHPVVKCTHFVEKKKK